LPQSTSLITEQDYIDQKKENVYLENQRLPWELKNREVKSNLLALEKIHKRLLIKETRARIKMYEAITAAAQKKARLELHFTPSSQVSCFVALYRAYEICTHISKIWT
jgi:hypothetical protein